MWFHKVNLREELLTERKKSQSEADILSQVLSILAENEKERAAISEALHTQSSTKSNALRFDLLETDRIFHLDQIRTICVDYRLRFLDSSIFKNEIP